jgi:P27 family predicted phage terminase small subunit
MVGTRGSLKLPPHLRAVKAGEAIDTDEDASAASQVPLVAPTKPDAVCDNEELSKLWDQIVPQLDETGLVAPSDGPAIELALRHFLLARVAADQIEGDVTVVDHGHGGIKKHPAEAVFRAESEMFLRYAGQLGMTFVSRARTPAAKSDGDDDNPFA